MPVTKEREFEIGKDESWFANIKRTYDMFGDYTDARIRALESRIKDVDSLSLQAMQNAIETANMVSKQAVRHGDIAIDHQWNKEVAEGAAEASILRALAKVLQGYQEEE